MASERNDLRAIHSRLGARGATILRVQNVSFPLRTVCRRAACCNAQSFVIPRTLGYSFCLSMAIVATKAHVWYHMSF